MTAVVTELLICKSHLVDGSSDGSNSLDNGTLFTSISLDENEIASAGVTTDAGSLSLECVFIQPRLLSPTDSTSPYADQFAVRVRKYEFAGLVSPGPRFFYADLAIRRLDQSGHGWAGRLKLDVMWAFKGGSVHKSDAPDAPESTASQDDPHNRV